MVATFEFAVLTRKFGGISSGRRRGRGRPDLDFRRKSPASRFVKGDGGRRKTQEGVRIFRVMSIGTLLGNATTSMKLVTFLQKAVKKGEGLANSVFTKQPTKGSMFGGIFKQRSKDFKSLNLNNARS